MDIQTINERWRNAVDADTREIIATDAEALGFRYKACDCPGEWRKPACSDNAFGAPYDKPKPTGNAVTAPRPLGWYGGKAYGGKAEWINSHLPAPHSAQLYAEPFGGMAGVLMARQPAGCEIVNDLNGRIINWWEVVRDAPDEFAALVEFTPHSRTAFERAISDMDNESLPPIRRALAFHIVVTQNIRSTDNAKHSTDWRISYRRFKSAEWTAQRIYALARRMRLVQLECKPAVDFMARIADNADAVVYVDPPYVSADVSPYKITALDGLTEALRAQRGFVAVSGYGAEWDSLGWHRFEYSAKRVNVNAAAGEARTEVLWTNKQPPQRLF